ncbi:DUF2103 domain-containing protein [Mucisphaera sp.]|uniref:DUF2103 domain-containing protein n=1 Tax=Mucisphaera sp. TaxID=2913024 RepID=UPI003D0B6C73
MAKPGGKFGPIKRQHGRVQGLDALLDRIINECPYVTRIVPGRFGRKRGKTKPTFKIQYPTTPDGSGDRDKATGLKCLYTHAGSWQEVFLVCEDVWAAEAWLVGLSIAEPTEKHGPG